MTPAQRLLDAAQRLVAEADFRLGGVLSNESKARDIPSNAYSQVKARHLASLRNAVRAALAETAEPVASIDPCVDGSCECCWTDAAPQPPAPAVELPPLPETNTVPRDYFTADQMRDFARAAIAAHEARKGGSA